MKRVLSVIFATFLLVSQQAMALNLNDMVDTAHTKSSTWTSPMTGEKYFYSGSYEFTFNNTQNYAPWFNAGGSSDLFKAGCGGFSIGDMFMSMLGLNDIKDQLSGAGAKLAWGIMLGMVFSMPGIHDVFMSVQKWARAIQKLLQDACKIGQALAKDTPFHAAGQEFVDNLASSDVGQAITNAKTGLKGFIDTATQWVEDKDCYKYTGAARESCQDDVKNKIKEPLKKIAESTTGTSITSLIIGSTVSEASLGNASGIYVSTLKNYFNSGNIGTLNITSSTDLDDVKTTLSLDRLFFGDSGIASASINKILALTNCTSLGDAASKHECTVIAEKIKNETVKNTHEGGNGNFDAKSSFSVIPAVISSPEKIAKAFLYGLKAESSAEDGRCGDGYCYIKNDYIVYANIPYSKDSNGSITKRVRLLGAIPNSANSSDSNLRVNWDGAIKESYKSIKYYVKEQTGINGNIGIFKDQSISSDTKGNIPLVVPGIGKYISIIAKLEKKDKKETAFTASLKELLAKYNAYLFSKSFFDMIRARINASIGDSITGATARKFYPLNQQIDNIYNATLKQFDTILAKTEKFKTVVDIFKAIDMKYRQDVSNSLR